ncbi:VOC family protein [Microbaculum marinum]|uniref:VOC family protein n=1 Tax=Microbaculum marinum TaxID=1764581 RepID=A0AAW9RVN7_9HYPH
MAGREQGDDRPVAGAFVRDVNLFAADPQRLAAFYSALFGFAEIEAVRSPVFRCLDAGGVRLGFNGPEAYALLDLSDRQAPKGTVGCYVTVELADDAAVDDAATRAVGLGATLIKPPCETYYNAWQCVLADPEDNVFRIQHQR